MDRSPAAGEDEIDLAEDSLAEAYAQAAARRPSEPPDNPTGWLATTAAGRAALEQLAGQLPDRPAPRLLAARAAGTLVG